MADPALVRAVADIQANVINQTAASVRAVWAGTEDLSDEAAGQAVGQVVPLVRGAQQLTAALHTSYVSQVVGLALQQPEVALLLEQATWNRSPIKQARRLVGEGASVVVAFDQAGRRAAQVHTGDVLRARDTATSALGAGLEDVRPVRWAKVPQPNACEWCRLVSTKLYFRPDGLPVHLHCRCGLDAVTPDQAGGYTNASTVFSNYRWRSRVSTRELGRVQAEIARSAAALTETAYADMLAAA